MLPVPHWSPCARARLSLPKRGSSMGGRLPHIRFAQRRWRSGFRKSSSIRIGASLIMATSSRRAGFLDGATVAFFSFAGFFVPALGGGRRGFFFSIQPRGGGAFFIVFSPP